MSDFDTLLTFFRALGNENRLRIIAMLMDDEMTVGQIAELLELREPTVSEHLATLREAGLVTMRAQGNFRYYSFDAQALTAMNRTLLSRDHLAEALRRGVDAEASGIAQLSAADQAVLVRYLDGETLTQIPAGLKKRQAVLRWLAAKFEVGRRYTEPEVNAIIKRHHDDSATLRRELIASQLMQRDRDAYWRDA